MTKKELENKISELEKQIIELKRDLEKEELEKEDGKMPVGEIWKPKEGESYVWHNIFTDDYYKELNTCTNFDILIMNSGSAYPTEEKAEFEANREKYLRLFRQYVEQHSEPLDWNNQHQIKYCIVYNHKGQNMEYLEWGVVSEFLSGGTYASSKEVLQEAVDFVGEENVLKYIL